jgi:alkanesulfonate monooxygenase SsuD/methylene tetrahydromethanopterin reductase-like flavin-dependent oxidoreductase (luciferase family)
MSTTVEQAIAQGILFAGTPDSVFAQLKRFHDDVGGFGHLTMIGRTGYMTHAESEKSIRLFGKEVLPRLKGIEPVAEQAAAQ